jgi:hypothetical protein
VQRDAKGEDASVEEKRQQVLQMFATAEANCNALKAQVATFMAKAGVPIDVYECASAFIGYCVLYRCLVLVPHGVPAHHVWTGQCLACSDMHST